MDDGAATASGLYLHTEGFEYKDVYKLAGILHYKFNFDVTVQNHNKKPLLYIKSKSMPLFRSLVMPHMHPTMFYKLGL